MEALEKPSSARLLRGLVVNGGALAKLCDCWQHSRGTGREGPAQPGPKKGGPLLRAGLQSRQS